MRARLGIGAILVSVYDAKKDAFPTIAKVGSGFSERGWIELRKLGIPPKVIADSEGKAVRIPG